MYRKGTRTREGCSVKKQCGTLFLAARAERSKRGQAGMQGHKAAADGESLPAHQEKQLTKRLAAFCFYMYNSGLEPKKVLPEKQSAQINKYLIV